ncbi:MAG TPA: RNA 2',3'-cyclic phosphodiesterase [Solirubrobacteraceae bacterium]|nr:RNA 2',3'-cyclic phosphodiesterase [Solirubrobacteraceae bacterium]
MSHGATARLFAALDPPAAVREQLSAWAREVSAALRASGGGGPAQGAKVRLLAPETMHVTLCFLGSRPVGEIDVLADALEAASLPEVGPVSLGAPLWLPPREPRTLALEIHDAEDQLAALQRCVSETFAEAVEWEPERRRFRAHLTVARLGRGGKPSRGRGRGRGGRKREQRHGPDGEPEAAVGPMLPATPRLSFTPRGVVLYRSWLDSEGARYEALAARELTASSASPSSSSSSSDEEGAGAAGEL